MCFRNNVVKTGPRRPYTRYDRRGKSCSLPSPTPQLPRTVGSSAGNDHSNPRLSGDGGTENKAERAPTSSPIAAGAPSPPKTSHPHVECSVRTSDVTHGTTGSFFAASRQLITCPRFGPTRDKVFVVPSRKGRLVAVYLRVPRWDSTDAPDSCGSHRRSLGRGE